MSAVPDRAIAETGPRIEPLGDGALLVTFGATIDLALNERARRLAAAVDRLRAMDSRFGRPVPAYASVLVPFDPVAVDPDEARRLVGELVAEAGADRSLLADDAPRDVVEIPVRYGGRHGPDLADVAEHRGLHPSDVVEIHAGTEYRVFFLGFAPGFAYLGTLPDRIATPRLATPRERVPAGSVGIAGSQTGVYPFALPGGWRIIGQTDVAMWDLTRDPPSLLRPGDRVRFVPVD